VHRGPGLGELAGEGAGTGLLDLPGDVLQLIADRAAEGSQDWWVSLWHVCRRLRWLVLFGEDAPEGGFGAKQISWIESRREGTWKGEPFPYP
jgi:hypothetical protein